MKNLMILLAFGTLLSCVPKVDNPYFDQRSLSVRGWNVENAEVIKNLEKESYQIAVVADSHGNYKDLETVVARVNATPEIDLVVHLGDFTNRSLASEFKYFMEIWKKLRMPSLVVLGNHDAIGLGPKIYARMFGPANFAVNAGWLQLILLNSNTLETGPIDYPWLEQELATQPETINKRLIFRHTNHDNHVHHSEEEADHFVDVVKKHKVSLVVNGHRHSYHFHQDKGFATHQVARVEGQAFSIITVSREEIAVQACQKGGCPRERSHKVAR